MKPEQYRIEKTEKYALVRKIGTRRMHIVSDKKPERIRKIYQKIQTGQYAAEHELFEDVFRHYGKQSLIPALTNL